MRCFNFIIGLSISFILLFSGSVSSKTVSKTEAHKTAENFLDYQRIIQSKGLKKQIAYTVDKIEPLNDPMDNEILAHVVSIQPKGFLILSADPGSDSVIAYSFQQDWISNTTDDNIFYQLLIRDLTERREQSITTETAVVRKNIRKYDQMDDSQGIEDIKFYQWPDIGSTETSGWVNTKWTQGTPYKDFCPVDTADSVECEECPVGCAALAWAQVVNYHQYIGDLHFSRDDQYKTQYTHINVDEDSAIYEFPGFSSLNRMLEVIKHKYENNIDLDNEDKAALCFACGILLKMNYTGKTSFPDSPSAIGPLLTSRMGYQSAQFMNENNKFYTVLSEEMINGRPAVIFLKGHAIVADGYNTNGFFHLNFGWNDGNPAPITETWYRPYRLPKNYESFIGGGILNINPTGYEYHPKITPSDSLIYLPCSRVGEESATKDLTLYNSGETPLTIDDILISGNFYFLTPGNQPNYLSEPTVLQPGEVLELSLYSLPDMLGRFEGEVQVLASYGGVKKYRKIELIGHGVPQIGTTVSNENISGLWERAGSPYYICDNVRISAGQTLEIEAGIAIEFLGSYQLTIENNARLVATGTKTDSIYFTSACSAGWLGLRFVNSDDDDTLAYCVIANARTAWGQAPLYAYNSSPSIAHSSIVKNKSSFYSGAIYLYNSSSRITHSRIEENTCTSKIGAGALHMYKSSPFLSNILICNNADNSGGTIYGYQSSPSLVNITIAHNTSYDKGGAIHLDGKNHFYIKNSIIWANEAASGSSLVFAKTTAADTISLEYTDIDTTADQWLYMENRSEISRQIFWGEGNLSQDPLFQDPQTNDFTLQLASPCIDAGDVADEVGDEPTPNGSRINLGAYGGTVQAAITIISSLTTTTSPMDYKLCQNYPNPFNPRTTIKYQLQMISEVELSVYNVLGQKVATLVSENQPAGEYNIEWDASGLASGMYYYRLTAGQFVETKRLVLLK